MARLVLVLLVVALIGTATLFAARGVWGESASVISTRTGSSGGGYGLGGGGVK